MNDLDLWDEAQEPSGQMAPVTPPSAAVRQDPRLRWYFLRRLERCLRLGQQVTEDSPALQLVRRATYSTYCDCLAAGATQEAQLLLATLRPLTPG